MPSHHLLMRLPETTRVYSIKCVYVKVINNICIIDYNFLAIHKSFCQMKDQLIPVPTQIPSWNTESLKPHSLVVTSLPWPPVTYIIQGNVCPNTQSHIQEYFQFKNPIVTLIQSNVFMSIPPPEPTPCSLQLVYPSWLFAARILTIAAPNPSIQRMNESFSCPQSSSN